MPFQTQSNVMTGRAPAIYPTGSEVVVQRGAIEASTADVTANSVGALVTLPAGCVPVGVLVDGDGSLAASVGFVNAAETAIDGTAWATGVSGNASAPTFNRAMARITPAQVDRKVGLLVTTAGTAGPLGMTLLYRSA